VAFWRGAGELIFAEDIGNERGRAVQGGRHLTELPVLIYQQPHLGR
jgi:hypothetical protein